MADRDPRARRRQWPPTAMSARKSAPFSAGGVNAHRLAVARAAREQMQEEKEEDEEEEKTPATLCGSPFCKAALANRYARFCEDKPMCQRYRALKLQCLANAQAEEDEEDMRPLSHVIRRRKREEDEKEGTEETFAIPRRKKVEGERRLNLSVAPAEESRSNSSSPREKEKGLKHKKKEGEKRQRKRLKRARSKAGRDVAAAAPASNASSVQGSSASSTEEVGSLVDRMKKRIHPRDSRTRQPPDMSIDVENGGAAADVSRIKKRRLNRHVSADDVLTRSASSSLVSVAPTAVASDATWKIPRARPRRATTVAQEIRKNVNVELVPLGVAGQTNLTGGGRYVKNGNRSSLRPSDLRPKPPSKTKFSSPAAAPSLAAAIRPPSAATPSTSSRPMQMAQSTAPTPPAPQTQAQLPPFAPPTSRPSEAARAVTPLSSPVTTPAPNANASTASIGMKTSGVPGVKRISTSDYLKNKKGGHERRSTDFRDPLSSASSSLERSSNLTDDRGSGIPPAPAYLTGPPGYHRSDSAPLQSYRESRPIDPRRQYPDAGERHQRPHYDLNGRGMEYRAKSEGRGEPMLNERSPSGQWEAGNFPPPRDHYPPRQQESSSFATSSARNGSVYEYVPDMHFSPASSPAEQPFRRETSREELPRPQRKPSPRRSELPRSNDDRRADLDDLDEDAPTFSYHESFLPLLLSIFIHKLPQSLEAVFNVTKKPRKMNWYIKYAERIERLCQPCDLRIKIEGFQAVVTVRGREWLTLRGTSTVALYMDVIKSLRAEAMTWLRLYEEMDKALDHCKGIYGNKANESYTFLRAWNDLKSPGNYISLSRQANYFCGARLHHWNFVVGKIEIGSGSHEEKREAFRLATVSALDFLLSVGRGGRRRIRIGEVKPGQVLKADRLNARGGQRSSSRESSASSRVRALPANERLSGVPAELSSFAGPQSSVGQSPAEQPPSSTEPPPAAKLASSNAPQSSAEPSSSPIIVERTEKPGVAIIRTTNSNSSREVTEAVEQSDPGEEMSISDASELGVLSPTASPGEATLPSTNRATFTESFIAPVPPTASARIILPTATKPTTATISDGLSATAAGDSGIVSDIASVKQTTAKLIAHRRCMMCEMIRMRKPDGERCLRCQQKGEPPNGVLETSLGP